MKSTSGIELYVQERAVHPMHCHPNATTDIAGSRVGGKASPTTNKAFSAAKDLPIHGRAQGGEEGNISIEEHPIDWTFRPADLQGVQGAFAVFVTGDSMEPKYKNQDLAYIHPTLRPLPGRYVLIETIARGSFIKRFESWRKDKLVVRQYNPEKNLYFERQEIRSLMTVIGSLDA